LENNSSLSQTRQFCKASSHSLSPSLHMRDTMNMCKGVIPTDTSPRHAQLLRNAVHTAKRTSDTTTCLSSSKCLHSLRMHRTQKHAQVRLSHLARYSLYENLLLQQPLLDHLQVLLLGNLLRLVWARGDHRPCSPAPWSVTPAPHTSSRHPHSTRLVISTSARSPMRLMKATLIISSSTPRQNAAKAIGKTPSHASNS